ncbi:RNA polymerase sigma factor [Leucobacter luti]|uniref:RNA polymerase sigma factor n=1 Tax=Leucobacter luti TaxID=340320 RepID=UPI001C68EAB9|nr:sigma-70 family RNA polymerase sigma factor [Leucobacter luti]QYM75120.1 RNA polymerase sigma factor [Leucobacter luti]
MKRATFQSVSDTDTLKDSLARMVPELVGYFNRRLGNLDDASDAAGDTLVEVLRSPQKIPSDPIRFRQYVFGIARHVLARTRRGRIRNNEIADRLKAELKGSEQYAAIPEDPLLADAIGRLGGKDQELLLLVAWEGFSIVEAGATLGLKPDAARKRYSRLKQALRAQLG